MHRERVSDNVYWFQSEVYAQVTAGAITGPNWAVVIDTLALPDEAVEMRSYIEETLGVPVRYVINTHYHADHAWGNCFFPGATVISHAKSREIMLEKGNASLEAVKKQNPLFKQVKLVEPHMTFSEGSLTLRIGKKTLILSPMPGHSIDGISVLVEEDRVLFAGDAFMPIPYVVDGNPDDLAASIKRIGKMGLENIVQGHGDIILRGEIEEATRENLAYLVAVRKAVRAAAKKRDPLEALAEIDIESCGKSRVTLAGLGVELHKRNVAHLYRNLESETTAE
jgi:glyoxylase-like metal-dependent hydrolase (beta-lactamase superfamily II)